MALRARFEVSNRGLAGAAKFLGETMGELGAEDDVRRRAAIILDEICANMIRHDPELGPEFEFSIELRQTGGAIEMEISDPGRAFDPVTHNAPSQSELGGKGLALVRGMASAVSYARVDNENRLVVAFRQS